ncbi:MAG: hypothetical protein MUO27_06780 [Sedimentisphaerales bacterium]|nr:hypothetical protein [Sedimentisphaerales bacterium]
MRWPGRRREVRLDNRPGCFLRADYNNGALQFSYSLDKKNWEKTGPLLNATRLSDENCKEGCFTGTFAGICCQDIFGTRKHADFDFFEYREL